MASRTEEYARNTRRAAIAAAHAEGLTVQQIADRLGIKTNPVWIHMRTLGLQDHAAKAPRQQIGVSLASTPWDAPARSDRPETAPRDGTKVSPPREAADPELLTVAGVIDLIRAEHRKVTA